MAAETNTLLGQAWRFEAEGRGNLRPDTEIAYLAIREKARA
jgi:hypothetical protein